MCRSESYTLPLSIDNAVKQSADEATLRMFRSVDAIGHWYNKEHTYFLTYFSLCLVFMD